MIVRGFIRKVSDGTPVPDGTEVVFRRHVDDSLLATTVTSGGMYELVLNGSPGPYYVRAAISDEVHISSSKVVGMSGPIDIGNLPLYFRLWTDGYIVGILDQMSVFATGSGMQVTVRSGATLVKGVLYDQPGQAVLPVDAADAQPRIDTVVIEAMVPGSGPNVEGRTRLVVKKGTPAASPVAPSLTQLVGGIWEHPLANITVDPGVSSIASNKVTDRRVQSNVQIGPNYITTTMLADDSVTAAKMAPNSVGSAEIVDGSVGTAEIADGSVTRWKLGAGAVQTESIAPAVVTGNHIVNGTITGTDIANEAITWANMAAGSVGSVHIVDGSILEGDLSAAVQTKLNASPEAPVITVERNATKTNFASASTLITSTRSLAAGNYVWHAAGTLRCTGEASATQVKGWLRILRNGVEQNAEPFYTTADAYGIPAEVFTGGGFYHGGGTLTITLDWTRDSGTLTANSRQLFLFTQKVG